MLSKFLWFNYFWIGSWAINKTLRMRATYKGGDNKETEEKILICLHHRCCKT